MPSALSRSPPPPLLGRGEAGGTDAHIGALDSAEARERVGQHVELEGALVVEVDVTEVGAAGAQVRGHRDIGLPPDVRTPMRRRLEHLEHLGPPERLLADVGQPDPHALARNRVGHEHDAASARGLARLRSTGSAESSDEHAAVGDARDIELQLVAGSR